SQVQKFYLPFSGLTATSRSSSIGNVHDYYRNLELELTVTCDAFRASVQPSEFSRNLFGFQTRLVLPQGQVFYSVRYHQPRYPFRTVINRVRPLTLLPGFHLLTTSNSQDGWSDFCCQLFAVCELSVNDGAFAQALVRLALNLPRTSPTLYIRLKDQQPALIDFFFQQANAQPEVLCVFSDIVWRLAKQANVVLVFEARHLVSAIQILSVHRNARGPARFLLVQFGLEFLDWNDGPDADSGLADFAARAAPALAEAEASIAPETAVSRNSPAALLSRLVSRLSMRWGARLAEETVSTSAQGSRPRGSLVTGTLTHVIRSLKPDHYRNLLRASLLSQVFARHFPDLWRQGGSPMQLLPRLLSLSELWQPLDDCLHFRDQLGAEYVDLLAEFSRRLADGLLERTLSLAEFWQLRDSLSGRSWLELCRLLSFFACRSKPLPADASDRIGQLDALVSDRLAEDEAACRLLRRLAFEPRWPVAGDRGGDWDLQAALDGWLNSRPRVVLGELCSFSLSEAVTGQPLPDGLKHLLASRLFFAVARRQLRQVGSDGCGGGLLGLLTRALRDFQATFGAELVDARLSANCDSGSSGDAAAEICAEALAAEYNWSAAVEEVRLCRLALKTSLTPHLLARLARHRLWRQFSRRLSDWPCLPGPARAPAEELAGSPPDGLTIRQFDRLVARLLLGLGFLGPAGWRQARQLLVPFCGGEFFPSEFFDKWINPEEIMQPFNCENSIRHEFRSQQSNCGICVLLIDPCDDTNNKNFENEVEEKLRQFGRILITRPAASDSGDGTARFVLQLSNLDDLFHAEQDWSFRVRCRFVLPGAEIFPEPPAGPPTSCRPDCPVRRLPPGAFQDGVLDRLAPSDWLRLSRSCVCFRRLVSWRPRLGLRLRQLDFADSGDSLDDSGERQQEEDELQQFLRCLGSASDLRSLSVTKATPPGLSLALSRIARCLPALTELRLPVCPSPLDCLLAGDSLRCLTVLHLADPDSRLPRGWRRSSRQAVKRFNDQALWLLMRGCGRHLEQLSLPAQQLRKAEAFCFIADCRLRQLTLTNVANETVVTAAAEACGSGLVSLRLTLARRLERLGDRVGWEKLEKLEELRIERPGS
ncbi:hypothetical protein BOX15_Mlig017547g1, partial [Macrostomum lignano]